ncbi:OmpA/MotB family protein [Chondromyces apiculatus]|uniref:Flagellar motor rotation protein MotB n=1 Tax=Chondromyces apiculatus DSM 436 TaxID=1192034 RepID=A0A017T415_9BACT|nr:OmpA family protein [Chondromyces apiculatus]EYF03316.1 Flagellar motor rotation protein MotB [Chondromyces apiculatus DSM 436]
MQAPTTPPFPRALPFPRVLRAARTLLPLALALSFFAAGATGCVSAERYDKAVDAIQKAQAESKQRGAEIEAQRGQLARAGADLAARDEALKARDAELQEKAVAAQEASTLQADLIRRLDEAALLNAEMSERLRKAGKSVQELAGERGTLAAALAETRGKLEELARQQAAADARASQFRELEARLKRMVDAGQLKVAMREGRMILELPNDVLFDSARTDLKPAGKAALVEVAKVLSTMADRRFQVGGHTDNVKMQGARFASNWELSTARAVEVVKLLIESGMKPGTLSAAGYGEFAPIASNDTTEGKARNRRIEIALVPDLAEMVKPPEPKAAPPAAPPRK